MDPVDQVVSITHLNRNKAEALVQACGGDSNAAIAAHFDGSAPGLIDRSTRGSAGIGGGLGGPPTSSGSGGMPDMGGMGGAGRPTSAEEMMKRIAELAKKQAEAAGGDAGEGGDGSSGEKTITMYKNCFTVDDGEPRLLSDPANADFLESVRAGRVPAELARGGRDVSVAMVDKSGETLKIKEKPKVIARAAWGAAADPAGAAAGGSGGGEASSSTAPIGDMDVSSGGASDKATMKVSLPDGRTFKLTVDAGVLASEVAGHIATATGRGRGGAGVVLQIRGKAVDGGLVVGDGKAAGTVKLHRQKVEVSLG